MRGLSGFRAQVAAEYQIISKSDAGPHYESYWKNRKFASEEAARDAFVRNIEHSNQQHGGIFGKDDPLEELQHVKFVKVGNAWKIKSAYPKARAPRLPRETPDKIQIGKRQYSKIKGGVWKKLDLIQVGNSYSSISSSLYNWEELPDLIEVPYSELPDPTKHFGKRKDDTERAEKLAREIKKNKKIEPLIVVFDKDGPYILEGQHRFVALHLLGYKAVPALAVLDEDSLP